MSKSVCNFTIYIIFGCFFKRVLIVNFQILFIWKCFYFPCYQRIVLMIVTKIANCHPSHIHCHCFFLKCGIPWVLAKHMGILLGAWFLSICHLKTKLWPMREKIYEVTVDVVFKWKPNALPNQPHPSSQTRMGACGSEVTLISNILGHSRTIRYWESRFHAALHGKATLLHWTHSQLRF